MLNYERLNHQDHQLGSMALRFERLKMPRQRHQEADIFSYDLEFGLTKIIADLILELDIRPVLLEDVKAIIAEFNNKNSTSFAFEYFHQKGWIRLVNESVAIAPVIKRTIRKLFEGDNIAPEYEKQSDELKCIKYIHERTTEKKHNELTAAQVEKVLLQNGSRLDTTFLVSKGILKEEAGRIFFITENNEWSGTIGDRVALLIYSQVVGNDPTLEKTRQFIRILKKCYIWSIDNFFDYWNHDSHEKFYKLCIELLQGEAELLDIEKDEKFYFLFAEHSFDLQFDSNIRNVCLKSQSTFQLLYTVFTEYRHYRDYYHYQADRVEYRLLLRFIVLYECNALYQEPFRATKHILKDLGRPYLIFAIFDMISEHYPAAIPFLLKDKELAPVAFLLLEHAEITGAGSLNQHSDEATQAKYNELKDLWMIMLRHLFAEASGSFEPSEYGNPIAKILYLLSANVFSFGGGDFYRSTTIHNTYKQIYDQALLLLEENRWNPRNSYSTGIRPELITYLLPAMATALELIGSSAPRNHVLDLQASKLDLMAELLKLASHESKSEEVYEDIREDFQKARKQLTDLMYRQLHSYLTTNQVEVDDYLDEEKSDLRTAARTETFGLEIVNWAVVYGILNEAGLLVGLNHDVSKSVDFAQDGQDHENRRAQIDKIRIYIKSLLTAFVQISRREFPHEIIGIEIANTRKALEMLLEKNLLHFSRNDRANARVDIFSGIDHFFISSPYQATIETMLSNAIQYMDQDIATRIVDEIFSSRDDLDKLLTIINNVENKNVVAKLVAKVETITQDSIDNLRFYNLEAALIAAVNSTEYPHLAEALLKKMETFNKKGNKTWEAASFIFRIKLILALRKNDLQAIKGLSVPSDQHFSRDNRMVEEKRKEFYEALYYLQNKESYDLAINKLEKLKSEDSENLDYAYQLYRAEIYKSMTNDQ